jgi:hypothetical protein
MPFKSRLGFRRPRCKPRQRRRAFLILLALLMLPDATVSADAQEMINCDARDVMTNALMNDYAEQPAGLGVTNTGAVIELWQAEGGSS